MGERSIKKLSSYLMFIGILIIGLVGNYIIQKYDEIIGSYSNYTYLLLGAGIVFILVAFGMNHFSSEKFVGNEDAHIKDNRELINKWWNSKFQFSKWSLGILFIPLIVMIVISIINFKLAMDVLGILFFIGMAVFAFIYVVQGKRIEEPEDLSPRHPTLKMLLHFIDYRRHPFNLSLIIFVLVVVSFLISKEMNIPLHMETSGNPRYVASLPSITVVMSGVMLASTFIYIINNGDIFGIRRAVQNEEKVMAIHFLEILTCGVAFFIWIFTIIEALVMFY